MAKTESSLRAPLLIGRYQPIRLLAKGGSSSVFEGRDQLLGRGIAIKLFSGGSESEVERYREELRLLAGLSHHGIVSIIDAGVDLSSPEDPRPFLVMELVRGKTLRETIRERQLSAHEVGEIGYEIAEALEYVHFSGVIHRDITPSNIMLADYGTDTSRTRAKLTDFGIAIDGTSSAAPSDTITGTLAYVSPEQVTGRALLPATDIYSLGLVLLECFTRERAFPGKSREAAMRRLAADPGIPESVGAPWRSIIERMTSRKPIARPTAAVVADELRLALRSNETFARGEQTSH